MFIIVSQGSLIIRQTLLTRQQGVPVFYDFFIYLFIFKTMPGHYSL